MSAFKDLTGQKFGKLTALELVPGTSPRKWRCLCQCGREVVVVGAKLTIGHTRSCGCSRGDALRGRGNPIMKTRLHRIWSGMKDRCRNKNSTSYKNYGGRGITVCEEWKDFKVFYEWSMSHGYSDELTIDRIDVNGNYCPENCRWVTPYEQARNKRDNKFLTFDGKTMIQSDWEKETGISKHTIRYRLKNGWSLEEALTTLPKEITTIVVDDVEMSIPECAKMIGLDTESLRERISRGWDMEKILSPKIEPKRYECFGKNLTLTEWSKETGINKSTLKDRLRKGWSIEKALNTPVKSKKDSTKASCSSTELLDSVQ